MSLKQRHFYDIKIINQGRIGTMYVRRTQSMMPMMQSNAVNKSDDLKCDNFHCSSEFRYPTVCPRKLDPFYLVIYYIFVGSYYTYIYIYMYIYICIYIYIYSNLLYQMG